MARGVEIGEGSILAQGGNGVVIDSLARIGHNMIIHQQVTIEGSGKTGGAPANGDGVYLGANWKILGDLTIGHNSVVDANAVVTKSVPPRPGIAGVPGGILRDAVDAHDLETA